MTENLQDLITNALDDLKGGDIQTLDVTELSDVMDFLIIATGTSNRHVKSLANNAIEEAKEKGIRPIGVEGMDAGEWVLVDFGDTVLHVMQQSTRDFYELEKLWSTEPATRKHDQEK
ncbi:ribosome silencing factor [Teredinibacter sp. KSP-S5-2]|uniref:ribosome silencing factor n=1 Tax=Teredinibacter sp. KSP-S5-2 TaxID=3034506 RepID=UPI00293424FF|nr:ribosome silencing factor [Teredinibacter sp. KSP-S5-2]WNO09503.1 ribosome silencing factor [Teredinibacter sp. KSP-S5-2]